MSRVKLSNLLVEKLAKSYPQCAQLLYTRFDLHV